MPLEPCDILDLARLTLANAEHISGSFVAPPSTGVTLVGQLIAGMQAHQAGRSWQGVIRVGGVLLGRIWFARMPELDFPPLLDGSALDGPSLGRSGGFELMLWVDRSAVGRGLGTRALAAALPQAREHLGCDTFLARVRANNAAMRRVVTSCAMVQVAGGPVDPQSRAWVLYAGVAPLR